MDATGDDKSHPIATSFRGRHESYIDDANADVVSYPEVILQSNSRKLGAKERYFGLPKKRPDTRRTFVYSNTDDYEQKYPEDAYGEELGPGARVWRTYLDEAQKADAELIEGWRDTTDVHLVFAGLFSAVVATFVVQTSTSLQPDYPQINAYLLFEQNALLRAMYNGTSLSNVPSSPLDPSSNASPSPSDKWVNGLWFTSLSLSLATAFIAVLVKQWMQHYVSVVSGTPREQARIRHFRFEGLERWNVPLIVGTLPTLLHLALLLYFAGLILFLVPMAGPIAYAIIAIAASAYVFYIVSTLLPLWDPRCPYKTTLSSLVASRVLSTFALISTILRDISSSRSVEAALEPIILYHKKEAEADATLKNAHETDAGALMSLYSTSSNPAVTSIVVQSMSGLDYDFPAQLKCELNKVIQFDIALDTYSRFVSGDKDGLQSELLTKVERFARAHQQLKIFLPSSLLTETFHALKSVDDPKAATLGHCLSMIRGFDGSPQLQFLAEGEDPIFHLENYTHASKELHPFVWSLLLRRCRLAIFDSREECSSHAFRVLDNFLFSFHRRDINRDHSCRTKFAMLAQYLCTVDVISQDDLVTPAAFRNVWTHNDVLGGSICDFLQVLPSICTMLSVAMDGWWAYGLPQQPHDHQDVQPWTQKSSLYAILKGIKSLVFNEFSKPCVEYVLRLRNSLQRLIESDTFWKCDRFPEDRHHCLELLFDPQFWSPFNLPRISWTPQLMYHHLHHTSIILQHNLATNFFPCDPIVYSLFREQDGLLVIDQQRCTEDFFARYLRGLLYWTGHPADRERELDYLFRHDNLNRVVQELTVKQNEDGDCMVFPPPYPHLVVQLFNLRPLSPAWPPVIEALVELTRNHNYFHRSPSLEAPSDGRPEFERSQYAHAYICITHLIDELRVSGLVVYEYVSGLDIENSRYQPSQFLYVDGLPAYAPYTIPILT